MLVVSYYIIFSITIIYGLYFVLVTLIGLIKESSYKFKNKITKDNYFRVLIPARNEEKVIENLIDSLKKQDYPTNKFDIWVVLNNCTDNTKEVVLSKKVQIFECKKKVSTKGEALKLAFEEFKNDSKVDAYVIFDADNLVHPKFLKNMNEVLESGYNVAQGNREAKNPGDNWISGGYTLFYLFQNIFYNKTRMCLNGTCAINGTGFMISKNFIDSEGFDTKTLTEDLEFTGLCALKNEKIAYVTKAITYDEYPNKFDVSWKQRKRWSTGIINCMKLYFFKLIKKGSFQSIDTALVYIGPLMQIISFLELLFLIIFKIIREPIINVLTNVIFSFAILVFLSIIFETIFIVLCKKKPSNVLFGILLFPIFILTWIPINIVCFLKKQTKWEEIGHNRNININELLK